MPGPPPQVTHGPFSGMMRPVPDVRPCERAMETALPLIGLVFALLFMVTLVRALIFGHRHRDRFADSGLAERSLWWFRLFQKNGFGPEAESRRRKLAVRLIVFGGLFFATGAAIQIVLGPPAPR